MISKAAVFCPSSRWGLMELTIETGSVRADLAHQAQGVVEIAIDGHHFRAIHEGLHQLAHGDFARRQQHDARDAGPRRIGGRRRGGVARGGANHGLGALFHRLRNGHGHAAVLERAGRVQPLVFDVDLRAPPHHLAQARASK